MPQSLRCKLSKLKHQGRITDKEYCELIKKLEGHDKEKEKQTATLLKEGQLLYQQGILDGYNKGIDEFAEALRLECLNSIYHEVWLHKMLDIAKQLKAGDKVVSEGMYSAVMVGTYVEADVAKQFEKAVEPYSTQEVLKAFIHSFVNGGLRIAPEEDNNDN